MELDYLRLSGHLIIYIVVWLLIYASNRKAIEKHVPAPLILLLVILFAFVSLGLDGLFPNFKEKWLSAISWPVFVNFFLLAYTIKERKKDVIYDLLSFLEEQKKYYREVIQSSDTELYEKRNARQMIKCLKYLERNLKGISLME